MEEMIKVNPEDLPYLHQFFSINLRWGVNFYDECLEYTRGYLVHGVGVFLIYLTPSFLLIPQYRYSDTKIQDRLGVEVKYDDIIKLENLSTFRIYKVPEDFICRFRHYLDMQGTRDICPIKIALEIRPKSAPELEWKDYHVTHINDSRMLVSNRGPRVDSKILTDALRTIEEAEGKSYSEFAREKESPVVKSIFIVEETLFILLSMLYTFYTNTYSKEDPEHIFFDKLAEAIQGFGDTFEDVFFVIKELCILTG